MTLVSAKRPPGGGGGDQLIVKTEKPKRRKLQEAAPSSSSDSEDESENSLSESTETESESERNITALKPIKEFGVNVQIRNEVKEEKPKTKLTRKQKQKLTRVDRSKKMKESVAHLKLGMVKPDIVADREKERLLVHIATKGVTQLFNKVAERQSEIENQAKKAKADKKPVNKHSLMAEPARPPLSHQLKIRVPMGPPASVKKEEDVKIDGIKETVTLNDTDTDLPTETEVKTEAESESD